MRGNVSVVFGSLAVADDYPARRFSYCSYVAKMFKLGEESMEFAVINAEMTSAIGM